MKRYDKYKPSGIDWIGEVPEHWEVMPLKHGADVIMGQSPSGEDIKDEGVTPFMQGNAEFGSKYPHSSYYCDNCSKHSRVGDILMSVRAPVGELNISDQVYGIGRGLCSIKSEKFDQGFLWFYLQKSKDDFNALANGSTFTAITVDTLNNYPILLPPLAEQEAIAAYLDARCADIDKVVATQQKRIALLQELKQSEITQAVTRGLNPDARMKDSGVEWIGMVPEHWEVIPFKSKFKTDKGLSITKADLVDEGVPVISYGQIHSKQNDYVHTLDHLLRFIPEEMAPADSKAKLEIGDIVFADTSEDVEGSGNAFYVDREGIYAGYHTVIAKSVERVDNKYFAYLFATPMWRSQVRSQVYGVKVFSITQQILKSTSLIAPPVEERKQIVEVLEEKCARIDKQIEKIQKQIELLREYKQALITEVVTGKRRV